MPIVTGPYNSPQHDRGGEGERSKGRERGEGRCAGAHVTVAEPTESEKSNASQGSDERATWSELVLETYIIYIENIYRLP